MSIEEIRTQLEKKVSAWMEGVMFGWCDKADIRRAEVVNLLSNYLDIARRYEDYIWLSDFEQRRGVYCASGCPNYYQRLNTGMLKAALADDQAKSFEAFLEVDKRVRTLSPDEWQCLFSNIDQLAITLEQKVRAYNVRGRQELIPKILVDGISKEDLLYVIDKAHQKSTLYTLALAEWNKLPPLCRDTK